MMNVQLGLPLAFFATLVTMPSTHALAAQVDDDRAGRVDAIFAEWNKTDSPGCTCAAMQDGEILHAKGYGMANLEHDVPLSPESVFYIASTSKQFAAAGIALLALDGTISLDDDIRKYLPELPDFGTPVTVRHLVHHTSGIRDYFNLLAVTGWNDTYFFDNDMVVELISRQRELNYEPGSQHLYSNSGYVLMAEIVRRASGKSLREFADERIFRPLGMRHTHFDDDFRQNISHRVTSFAQRDGGGFNRLLKEFNGHGDGNLLTTVGDLLRWEENFYDPQVGGRDFIDLMLTRGILVSGDTIDYAFGLFHGTYRGLPTVSHGGGFKGFRTQLLRFPEQHFSVTVLCNLGTINSTALAERVADIFLAEEFTEPSTAPVAASRDDKEAVAINPAVFDDYAGDYELEVQPGFIISFFRDGNQFFSRATGQDTAEIFPTSDSTFFITEVDASVTFHRDADGSVLRITLHQGGGLAAHRVEKYLPTAAELAEYVGRYYSAELETSYTLAVVNGKLVAKHRRLEDIELTPRAKDEFMGNAWFFGKMVVERDRTGGITGFRVSNGRVRNLSFARER